MPPALVGAAVQASDQGRYCEALLLFEAIEARAPSARALYSAAEVAWSAGDRVKALSYYRRVLADYPGFERNALVRRRVDEVFREQQRAGPGAPCPQVTPSCGDWHVDADEQCDDGNSIDGDGCDSNCAATGCGNGVTTAGERCDDGNQVDGDGCDGNCTPSGCGNGVPTSLESCDDGNTQNGDGCDNNCTPTGCGNGEVSAPEQCDDGNDVSGDGCDRGCVITRCGNGVRTAGEVCDDGNLADGDGCEATCQPTRRPAPGLGLGIAGAGGAWLAVGVALGVVGFAPLVEHNEVAAQLAEKRASYADDPEGALADVDDPRKELANTRDAWSTWGVGTVGAGAVLTLGGGAAVAVGTWLAFTRTEEGVP